MADTTEETPSQRQARIRREKREKKILDGAGSRLEKITSLSGRPAESTDDGTSSPSPRPTTQTTSSLTSNTPNTSSPSTRQTQDPTQEELESSMRQLLSGASPATQNRSQRSEPDASEAQDPMMAMLQQLMGASGNGMSPNADGGAAAPSFDGLPPGLAAMLGGGMGGGMPGMPGQPPSAEARKSIYLWKILHAVFALLLAGYIIYTYTAFSGTLMSRMRLPLTGSSTTIPAEGSLFWIFITAELCLQGGRFMLEGGQAQEGIVTTVAGFLPPPWGQRILLGSRYFGIWSTIVQDAFVVVFLLGVVAWWRGEVGVV